MKNLINFNTGLFGVKGSPTKYEITQKEIPIRNAGQVALEYIDGQKSLLPGSIPGIEDLNALLLENSEYLFMEDGDNILL